MILTMSDRAYYSNKDQPRPLGLRHYASGPNYASLLFDDSVHAYHPPKKFTDWMQLRETDWVPCIYVQ